MRASRIPACELDATLAVHNCSMSSKRRKDSQLSSPEGILSPIIKGKLIARFHIWVAMDISIYVHKV